MMRLLANENVPRQVVETLVQAGHDVLWARLEMPGDSDVKILDRAQTELRVLLTFDKDFGELAYRHGLTASSGVILFRFAMRSPQVAAERIQAIIASREDWPGHFAVVTEKRIRLRQLPQRTPGAN